MEAEGVATPPLLWPELFDLGPLPQHGEGEPGQPPLPLNGWDSNVMDLAQWSPRSPSSPLARDIASKMLKNSSFFY